MFNRSLFILSLLGVLACTGPKVPEFPENESAAVQRVKLGDNITIETIRSLVRALNKNGRYPGLEKLISSNHAALDTWTELFAKYWYQDSESRTGFIHTLQTQKPHFFTMWDEWLESWLISSDHQILLSFFRGALKHSNVPQFAKPYSPLLTIPWDAPAGAMEVTEQPKDLDTQKLSAELAKFFSKLNPEITAANMSFALRRTVLGSLKDSINLVHQNFGETNDLKPHFAELIRTSTAEKAFDLVPLLNRPSTGAFAHLGKSLSTGGPVRRMLDEFLSELLQSIATRSLIAEFETSPLTMDVWFSLENQENGSLSSAAIQLFTLIRKSMHAVTPVILEGSEDRRFERQTALYLNSLALTDWFRQLVRVNREQLKGLPIDQFQKHLLESKLTSPQFRFNISSATNGNFTLSASVEASLRALELDEFADTLAAQIKLGKFVDISYDFETLPINPFLAVLTASMQSINEGMPLAITDAAAGVLLSVIGSEHSDFPLTIASLDTPNIAVKLLAFIRDQPNAQQAHRLLKRILVDVGFAHLSNKGFDLLKSLFKGKPEWQTWIEKSVRNLNSIVVMLDLENGPSPAPSATMQLLHEFLQGLSNRDLNGLVAMASQIAETKLFSTVEFPQLTNLITSRMDQSLNRIKFNAKNLTQYDMNQIEMAFQNVKINRLFVEWLQEVAKNTNPLEILVGKLLNNHKVIPIPALEREQMAWISYFLSTGGYELLHTALRETGPETVSLTLKEINKALKNGEFKDILRLLTNVSDTRFRKGIEVLIALEASGELNAAIELMAKLAGDRQELTIKGEMQPARSVAHLTKH